MSNAFPDGWNLAEVQDVATIVRGASPRPQGDPRYYGGKVPRLMVKDVTRDGKYVTPKIDFLTEAGAALSRPMPAGTLTIVCSGTVGVPSILKVDACIHDGFLALKQISEQCDLEFLYHQFVPMQSIFDSSATHGGIFTNLTTQILKEFQIVIPPLPQQQKIAAILSSVDDVIEKTQAQINKLKNLKTGMMQELLTKGIEHTKFKDSPVGRIPVGWGVVPLRDVTSRIIVGLAISVAEHYRENGVPIIRNQNIKNCYFDETRVIYVSNEFANDNKSKSVYTDDVVTVRTGSNIGLTCLVPENLNASQSFTTLISTTKKDVLYPKYLMYHMNSDLGISEINRLQVGGGKNNLNSGELKNYLIAVPRNIEEQASISESIDSVVGKLNAVEAKLEKLQSTKKALMQDLLTGKIRVTVE